MSDVICLPLCTPVLLYFCIKVGCKGALISRTRLSDDFQAGCLKLTCPMLNAPVYGNFKKIISSTNLLGISASLKLFPEQGGIGLAAETSEFHVENFAETFFKKLQRKLGLVKGKCGLREEALCGTFGNNTIPEMFAVNIKYTTTEDCQNDFIIDRIKDLVHDTIKMQFDKTFVSLTSIAFTSVEYVNYCTSARDKYHMEKLSGFEYNDFQRLIGCPTVTLNASHYANLMKQASGASQRREIHSLFNLTSLESNVAVDNSTFSARVCFDANYSVFGRANHGVCIACVTREVIFVVLSTIICLLSIHIKIRKTCP